MPKNASLVPVAGTQFDPENKLTPCPLPLLLSHSSMFYTK